MSILVLAVSPFVKVEVALREIKGDNAYEGQELILASTKGYRTDLVASCLDIKGKMLSEESHFDFSSYSDVLVIQNTSSVISYINVYRFLRANGVDEFSIKCCGNELLKTSVDKTLGLLNQGSSNTDDVIWLSPSKLTMRKEFAQIFHGQEVSGDWDTQCTEFEQSVSFFKSLKQRIESDVAWNETPYYQDIMTSLLSGESRFGIATREELDLHCLEMDALYQSMKAQGWQQKEGDDYVTVNIGRSGQLIFNDGRHRLSCAKLLGLGEIPVKVAVRHSEWVAFKNEIIAFANEFYDGKVYAKITHPDLHDIECAQDASRLQPILQNLSTDSQTVLDIGSHWGFFCSELEAVGKHCTAVEADVSNFYFLNKLKVASANQFLAVNESIFDFIKPGAQYDVVLALNIFHHFLKSQSKYKQFESLLKNLEVKEMFLQTHNPDEPQMIDSFLNPSGQEFAELVARLVGLQNVDLLAELRFGRNLYKLS